MSMHNKGSLKDLIRPTICFTVRHFSTIPFDGVKNVGVAKLH